MLRHLTQNKLSIDTELEIDQFKDVEASELNDTKITGPSYNQRASTRTASNLVCYHLLSHPRTEVVNCFVPSCEF